MLGGSTSGGSAIVNATMRSIGLERTEMYGGYILGTSLDPPRELAARGVPLTVVSQPYWGIGKATTAIDLAELHRAIWLASAGLGPLGRPGSGDERRRGALPDVRARARRRPGEARPLRARPRSGRAPQGGLG